MYHNQFENKIKRRLITTNKTDHQIKKQKQYIQHKIANFFATLRSLKNLQNIGVHKAFFITICKECVEIKWVKGIPYRQISMFTFSKDFCACAGKI